MRSHWVVFVLLSALAVACGGGGHDGGGGAGPSASGWTRDASNPVLSPGPAAWDSQHAISPCVVKAGATYRMWYDGTDGASTFRIGTATSPDGIAWTKSAANPVLVPTAAWELGGIGMACVVHDGATYRMWYLGRSGGVDRIGTATSPDGVTWTKHEGNPVLLPGAAGAWDAEGVGGPSVLFDGATYRMWYTGVDAGGTARIGLATSPDGIAWTKSPGNPGLNVGPAAWDATGVEGPSVILDGGLYRMWFGGNNGDDERIGAAESADGIAWTKTGAPVFSNGPAGQWDENDVWSMSVMRDGATLRMWYTGDSFAGTGRIGIASAP